MQSVDVNLKSSASRAKWLKKALRIVFYKIPTVKTPTVTPYTIPIQPTISLSKPLIFNQLISTKTRVDYHINQSRTKKLKAH